MNDLPTLLTDPLGRRDFLRALAVAASIPVLGRRPDDTLVVLSLLPDATDGADAADGVLLGVEEANHIGGLLGGRIELEREEVSSAADIAAALGRARGAGAVIAMFGGRERVPPDVEAAPLLLNVGSASGSHLPGLFHVGAGERLLSAAMRDWASAEGSLQRGLLAAPADSDATAYPAEIAARIHPDSSHETAAALLSRTGADHIVLDGPRGFAERFLDRHGAGLGVPVISLTSLTPPPPAADVYWPAGWHESLFRYGATQLNERFLTRFGRPMTPAAWSGWMAVKVAWESFLRSGGTGLGEFLDGGEGRFDGHKGRALTFRRADRRLRQPVYILHASPGGEVEAVAEMPSVTNDLSWEDAFDGMTGLDHAGRTPAYPDSRQP